MMVSLNDSRVTSAARRVREIFLPVVVLVSILLIIVPLPAVVMDGLLSLNITLSVLILLTVMFVRTPLDFSTFPTLLLAATLFRLGLNVATTRMILTHADTAGTLAAGHVVQAFSGFVAGGSLAVGAVIFLIIVIIQFVVITKGATRISEVSARFVLDGLPGKQMAIDADVQAGAITHEEARTRKEKLADEVDFYGTMDGASKFVRGDAIAGMCITVINIAAGMAIGLYAGKHSLAEIAALYTQLTIGDGLVSQVPAFLIAIAAAMLVTRGSRASDLPGRFMDQVFSHPKALAITAVFVMCLALTPLPTVPLLILGAGCVAVAWILESEARKARLAENEAETARAAEAKKNVRVEKFLAVDPVELELGAALIPLVVGDENTRKTLMQRVTDVRRQLARELGFILPAVRVCTSPELDAYEYCIRVNDSPVARNVLHRGMLLAVERGMVTGPVPGMRAPAFLGPEPLTWMEPEYATQAAEYGYMVLGHQDVLAEHLLAVARTFAPELLSRDGVQHLLDELRKTAPVAVEELIPGKMSVQEVQKVLRLLLAERVSVRQLAVILETLGENADAAAQPVTLMEAVRVRLGRAITAGHLSVDGVLYALTLEPVFETQLLPYISRTAERHSLHLTPGMTDVLRRAVDVEVGAAELAGRQCVLVAPPELRTALADTLRPQLPALAVLGYDEIPPETQMEVVRMIRVKQEVEAA